MLRKLANSRPWQAEVTNFVSESLKKLADFYKENSLRKDDKDDEGGKDDEDGDSPKSPPQCPPSLYEESLIALHVIGGLLADLNRLEVGQNVAVVLDNGESDSPAGSGAAGADSSSAPRPSPRTPLLGVVTSLDKLSRSVTVSPRADDVDGSSKDTQKHMLKKARELVCIDHDAKSCVEWHDDVLS